MQWVAGVEYGWSEQRKDACLKSVRADEVSEEERFPLTRLLRVDKERSPSEVDVCALRRTKAAQSAKKRQYTALAVRHFVHDANIDVVCSSAGQAIEGVKTMMPG